MGGFLFVFKTPGTSDENVYFNTLISHTRCSSKVLFQTTIFLKMTSETVTDQLTFVVQLDCLLLIAVHFPFIFVYDDSAKCSYPLH